MATYNGNGGVVELSDTAVAEVLDFSIEETANTIDDTVLGDSASTHLSGLVGWSGSINCYWDDGEASQEAMTIGASVGLKLNPEGTGTGNYQYDGTATITGISVAVANDSIITRSFTFTGNGALTIGTDT